MCALAFFNFFFTFPIVQKKNEFETRLGRVIIVLWGQSVNCFFPDWRFFLEYGYLGYDSEQSMGKNATYFVLDDEENVKK